MREGKGEINRGRGRKVEDGDMVSLQSRLQERERKREREREGGRGKERESLSVPEHTNKEKV